uniref:Uncharacterized protein n=1 Tax=Oryza meridionalis TaxID=40149 RepID=A0A0E0CKK8_9ORYZ
METAVFAPHQVTILALPAAEAEVATAIVPGRMAANSVTSISKGGAVMRRLGREWARRCGSLTGSSLAHENSHMLVFYKNASNTLKDVLWKSDDLQSPHSWSNLGE